MQRDILAWSFPGALVPSGAASGLILGRKNLNAETSMPAGLIQADQLGTLTTVVIANLYSPSVNVNAVIVIMVKVDFVMLHQKM